MIEGRPSYYCEVCGSTFHPTEGHPGRAKAAVRAAGGDWVSSVSKNTDYVVVVVGENPGSKADKAKSLGIKVLKEEEFLKIIK